MQETCQLCDSIHYVSPLGGAVQPHIVSYAQESDRCSAMDYLQGCSFIFYS